MDNGGNERIVEPKSIVPVRGIGLACKAGLVERAVEDLAGAISGEHPSRAIRPMRCGS
jgi:hypothetical protein